jgi:hypothetical protein
MSRLKVIGRSSNESDVGFCLAFAESDGKLDADVPPWRQEREQQPSKFLDASIVRRISGHLEYQVAVKQLEFVLVR